MTTQDDLRAQFERDYMSVLPGRPTETSVYEYCFDSDGGVYENEFIDGAWTGYRLRSVIEANKVPAPEPPFTWYTLKDDKLIPLGSDESGPAYKIVFGSGLLDAEITRLRSIIASTCDRECALWQEKYGTHKPECLAGKLSPSTNTRQ